MLIGADAGFLQTACECRGCKDFLLTESILLKVYCKHVKVQGRPPRTLRAVSRHSKIKSKWSCARHILAYLMLSKISPMTHRGLLFETAMCTVPMQSSRCPLLMYETQAAIY